MSVKDTGGHENARNLTMRDHIAVALLSSMIASETHGEGMLPPFTTYDRWPQECARKAYLWADAMLKERAKDER